jgi:phytoene synthase
MSDDPLQRGTPPGSLRYFAVLYAPAAARATLHALYAFEAELHDTVRTTAHEVAHTRLQYWRGEVDRLAGGRPEHPVTRALLPLRDLGADLSLLHEVLAAADFDVARITLQNDAERSAIAFRACGSVQTLAAMASRGSAQLTASERDFARRLGAAIAEVEWLRDLRGDITAGRLRLPLDALEQCQLDPSRLLDEPVSPALVAQLERSAERVAGELRALPGSLTPAERSAQRQGLVLAALHARLLQRIDHRAGLARTRAEVPAWTRFWTAWRTAIRHA